MESNMFDMFNEEEEEEEYKIGDRLELIENNNCNETRKGYKATIITIKNSLVGVCFDNSTKRLHDIDGKCENNHGWFYVKDSLHLYMKKINNTKEKVETKMNNPKVEINKLFTNLVKLDDEQELKNNVEHADKLVKEFTEKLSRSIRTYKEHSLKLANYERSIIDFYKKIQEISRSTSIKNVTVDLSKECIVAFTECLYMRTLNGARYLGGHYKIEFYPYDNKVYFFNTDKEHIRRSYWGDSCHHPHVSYDGHACLGNTAESIAFLSGEFEYQALFDILIAFLEQANIEDCAGKHVMNWDKVDEEGNLVREGYKTKSYNEFVYNKDDHTKDSIKQRAETRWCGCCDDEYEVDEMTWIEHRDEWICEGCLENSYTQCPDCDEYEIDYNTHNIGNGRMVCENCFENYTECGECGEQVINTTEIDGEFICDDCKNEKYFYCTKCNEYKLKEEHELFMTEQGEEVCEECFGE